MSKYLRVLGSVVPFSEEIGNELLRSGVLSNSGWEPSILSIQRYSSISGPSVEAIVQGVLLETGAAKDSPTVEHNLKPGQVIQLPSGGPKMTITSITGDTLEAMFFDERNRPQKLDGWPIAAFLGSGTVDPDGKE